MPTTVGQQLACRLNKPWLNMDMDDAERCAAGIFEELENRCSYPLIEDDGLKQTLTRADLIGPLVVRT